MHDDLYFIPLITTAMDEPDRQAALRSAFERIRAMGQRRRHRRGYRQFLHWMQTVSRARRDLEAGRTSLPAHEILDRPDRIELIIEHRETRLASFHVATNEKFVIRCIAPGAYRFSLDTGRVLWDGSISAEGAFVSHMEPGRPLRMAAATTGPRPISRELRLLEGAVILRLRLDGPTWLLEVEFPEQRG